MGGGLSKEKGHIWNPAGWNELTESQGGEPQLMPRPPPSEGCDLRRAAPSAHLQALQASGPVRLGPTFLPLTSER